MARKTLKEKQIADTRQLYHFEKVVVPQLKTPQRTAVLENSDLAKTVLITTIILSFQVILFLSIKNHLFRIRGISY